MIRSFAVTAICFAALFCSACGNAWDSGMSKIRSARSQISSACERGDPSSYTVGWENLAAALETMDALKKEPSQAQVGQLMGELALIGQAVEVDRQLESACPKLYAETMKLAPEKAKELFDRRFAAGVRIGRVLSEK